MPSNVYFIDMRAKRVEDAIKRRLAKLIDESGVMDVVSPGDLVAVKTHFGTPGNDRHLRPQHLRVVVEKVKEAGGIPFVTETTGLGLASARGNAVKAYWTAVHHGFTSETLGAPVIIADGLKGLSGVVVEVDGARLKRVELAQAIAEADALISVAHAKGHPRSGFGGALKNISVGCLTKRGKAEIHMAKKPSIDPEKCTNCGKCIKFCPVGAIIVDARTQKPKIVEEKCIKGCGCWDVCPAGAITPWPELHHPTNAELGVRIADAALAVIRHLRGKVSFLNLAYEITPHCDCFEYGDVPMVPDIGILASRDPVAIDKASIDLINQARGIPGTAAEEVDALEPGVDKFYALKNWKPFRRFLPQGGPQWRPMLEAAVRLGIGRMEYRLIRV
ncbi:hypothetical protein DRO48_01130 [Candidatus Bathyarchaeota archaeon]|nr:MAG: hypothetical protein DRO48_01130 [Candidatus Bathyarchaeota archaeon]